MEGWHCHKICKGNSNIIPSYTKTIMARLKVEAFLWYTPCLLLFSTVFPFLFPPYNCNQTSSLEDHSKTTISYSVSVLIPPSLSHTHKHTHSYIHIYCFSTFTRVLNIYNYILVYTYHPSSLPGLHLFKCTNTFIFLNISVQNKNLLMRLLYKFTTDKLISIKSVHCPNSHTTVGPGPAPLPASVVIL